MQGQASDEHGMLPACSSSAHAPLPGINLFCSHTGPQQPAHIHGAAQGVQAALGAAEGSGDVVAAGSQLLGDLGVAVRSLPVMLLHLVSELRQRVGHCRAGQGAGRERLAQGGALPEAAEWSG